MRTIWASRSMRRRVALRQMPIADPSAPSRVRSVPPLAPASTDITGAGTAACRYTKGFQGSPGTSKVFRVHIQTCAGPATWPRRS